MSMNALGKSALNSSAVSPTKLAHIVLRTTDVTAMRDWYVNVLNAHVKHETEGLPRLCFITFDDEHHRLAFIQVPGGADPAATSSGIEHISFTYANLRDLLSTYERLRIAGIEPFWTIHHGPTISLYYLDPDKNRVELQIDTMSADEATEFIGSEAFNTNPIGVILDIDEMVASFKRGVGETSLLKQPSLPQGVGPFDMLR